jgi:LacI family transcriptional regulator
MIAPVTLAEVARMAGVSVATASRALHGGPRRPRDDLCQRVLQAAARLNYSPNAAAQAVARGHTNVVGLIVQDISDPYFSAIAAGVIQTADEHGAVTTMADTRRRLEREVEYVATLRQQRARAVILAGSRSTDRQLQRALQREIEAFCANGGRVALISQRQLDLDTVLIENRAGARALAEELCKLGHRSFAVLAGPASLVTSVDRLSGFKEGLTRHGIRLTPDRVFRTDFTRDGGYSGAEAFLASGVEAGCLFAVNDVMAVGAMAALRAHGVSLPADIAVAGFDDIPPLRDVVPSLTTVHVPLETLGVQAVELVLSAADPDAEPRVKRVSGTVVIRESTPALISSGR